MQSMNEVPLSSVKSNEEKQYFIEEGKFQLLKQCQKSIFSATELSPAIRKLVNELITFENLNQIKERYIKSFNI